MCNIDTFKKTPNLMREQLAAEGKPVTGFRFGWSPVLDGNFLPFQPTEAKALALSENVPLLKLKILDLNQFFASTKVNNCRKRIQPDKIVTSMITYSL